MGVKKLLTTKERPEYATWVGMLQRCTNPKNPRYYRYGGRGIKVCDEWWNSFENFYEDMGAKPGPNYSIERKDNNGDYCKENCVWATKLEQANNMSTNNLITYQGKTQTIAQWARELKQSASLISNRLCHGWDVERALTTPSNYKMIAWQGLSMSLSEWARYLGKPYATLEARLRRGWSVAKAFTK